MDTDIARIVLLQGTTWLVLTGKYGEDNGTKVILPSGIKGTVNKDAFEYEAETVGT